MISSEVQRTLVKSPPELWAELSDPSALARHLGELGEIRITRVEPEKLVEWEADRTKGTVAIKPSGWGTKVTLTVERELPAVESPDPTVAGPETTEEPALEVQTSAESADAQRDKQAESTVPTAMTSIGVELDAWASQEAEREHQPTITAAERFAHDDPEPLLGTRLSSDIAAEMAFDQAEAPILDAHVSTDLVRPAPTTPVTSTEPQADEPAAHPGEPRRGFLARLFGRRRPKTESSAAESAAAVVIATEPTPVIDPAPMAETARLVEIPPDTESIEPATPGEARNAVGPEPAPIPPAAEEDQPAPTVEDPAPDEAAEVIPTVAVEEALVEPVASGLAAELREAEDASTDEVRAVLTAVLDRLGAAHHRPFSRS